MLTARRLTQNTIHSYHTYLKSYLDYLSARSVLPEDASWQDMRNYISFIQKSRGLSDRTVNIIISYLQFFHLYVLHKNLDRTQIPFRRFDVFLPFVPSRTQVAQFLRSLDVLKYHVHMHFVSGGGLTTDHKIRRSGNKFFIPVAVLRDKLKGKFMSCLDGLYTEGRLTLPPSCEKLFFLKN